MQTRSGRRSSLGATSHRSRRRFGVLGAFFMIIASSLLTVGPVLAATQTSGGFVVFAKATGGADKHVDVSGSDDTFEGLVHSNGNLDVGGQNNEFLSLVTYVSSEDTNGNSFPGGGPTQVPAKGSFPGTLQGYSPDPALCTIGSFASGANVDVSNAPNGSVVCSGSGKISFSASGGTRVISFFSASGEIDVSGQNVTFTSAVDNVLAYSGSTSDVAVKFQGSNGVTDGIM